MAKLRISASSKKKNKNGILKLMVVVKKLHKSLFLAKKWSLKNTSFEQVGGGGVPEDVKEGHFAVIAADDYEERRFVVPLTYLTCPSFIRLLERAAEEYGFDHEGAVTIPCRPSELEGMLAVAEQWTVNLRGSGDHGGLDWSSCNNMVESC